MKKLSALVLGFILVTTAIAANTNPVKIRSNEVTIGVAGSAADKSIVLDINAGAANPKITSVQANSDVQLVTDRVKIGKAAAGNKRIIIDNNAGASNPEIRFNNSTSKLEFANDGSTFKSFGSGSGGDSGINILADSNPDAESGTGSWSASGGSFTATSTAADVAVGAKSFEWDPSGAQTLSSATVAMPAGVYGSACAAKIRYKTSVATYTLGVYDGSNVLQNTLVTLPSSTNYVDGYAFFLCPTSGSLYLRIASAGDVAKINFDSAFLGSNPLVSQVSQSTFVASGYISNPGSSCTWTRANTALGAFATSSTCPGPTVELNPGPGTLQTTDTDLPKFTLNNLPAGNYQVIMSGNFGNSTSSTQSLAINDGTTTSGLQAANTNALQVPFSLTGNFSYTTGGNRTFELYGGSGSGTLSVDASVTNRYLTFAIYRYPSSAETAVAIPNSGPAFAYAKHSGSDCSWTTTSTSFVNPSDDASCTFTSTRAQNITLASVGSTSPAVTWTPDRLRDYEVCADVALSNATGTASAVARFVDGSNVELIGSITSTVDSSGNTNEIKRMCGLISATSVSALTAKIQIAASSGTAKLGIPATGGTALPHSISWTVKALDTYMGAPILTSGMLTTNSTATAGERVERAQINTVCSSSPCTITSQSGAWLTTVTRSATGTYLMNYAGSIFSAAPACHVMGSTNQNAYCGKDTSTAASASSYKFFCEDDLHALVDAAFDIICMGPR